MIAPPIPIVAGRNLRVIRADGNSVVASRGSSLYRFAHGLGRWERILHQPSRRFAELSLRWHLWRRLFRSDIVAMCTASDGSIVCVGHKLILRASPGSKELSPVFRVVRGSRPLSITSAGGVLYWGEYFGNAARREVLVYGSRDNGRSWYPAYVFPARSIRHIHRILFDEERQRIWLLTGDRDSESRVLWTDDHFATIHVACEGSQQTRTLVAIPVPHGIIWGTDIPDGRNHIYLLRDDGTIRTLAELEGPSFYAARAGEFVLLSTAVEPSRINATGRATVMVAQLSDLDDWRMLLCARKDAWPMKLFQYGNVVLPEGTGEEVWASGLSVKGGDAVVWRWDLAALRAYFAAARGET